MNTLLSNLNWGVNGLIIGLATVFIVLIVLIIIIALMRRFINKGKKEKSELMPQTASSAPVKTDDGEVVAVISAAIACMAQREGKKFNIISFRRK